MRGIKGSLVVVMGLLLGCSDGVPPTLTFLDQGASDTRAQTVEEIQEICRTRTRETLTLEVSFPAVEADCQWGRNGNLPMAQGVVTGRQEQVATLAVPEGQVICDLELVFESLDPSFQQTMVYDDNFLLTFNDVVLAASYGPMVSQFREDEGLFLYEWDRLVGYPFGFQAVPVYCLGANEGLSECIIPPPESPGLISLDFGGELIDALSLIAVQEERYEFMFVTTGDNDPATDCSHAAFRFTVDVTVAAP